MASASSKAAARPQLAALTFGVELEFLFIVRKTLEGKHQWLKVEQDTLAHPDDEYYSDTPYDHKVYTSLARVLRNDGREVQIHATSSDKIDTFTKWFLQGEQTIDAVFWGLEGLMPVKVKEKDANGWNVRGVEMVSRVLEAPEPSIKGWRSHSSIREVEGYVMSAKGKRSDPFGACVAGDCGLHVHVGLNPNATKDETEALMPLPVLQHLAYILFQYETIISGFHPPRRRGHWGTPTAHFANSNLMGLRNSPHICDLMPPVWLEHAQRSIFGPGMTIRKLETLMSRTFRQTFSEGKNKFVNWAYLSGREAHHGRPQTIEFRQHEGTLESREVVEWIGFVVALIRAAERKARQDTEGMRTEDRREMPLYRLEGLKYEFVGDGQQKKKIDALFDLLELDRSARTYWLRRFANFSPDGVQQTVSTELCPKCNDDRLCRENGFFLTD